MIVDLPSIGGHPDTEHLTLDGCARDSGPGSVGEALESQAGHLAVLGLPTDELDKRMGEVGMKSTLNLPKEVKISPLLGPMWP